MCSVIMRRMVINLFFFVLTRQTAKFAVANWLSLALSGASDYTAAYYSSPAIDQRNYELLCERLAGLNPVQQAICRQHPFAMPSVRRGARDSIVECQMQFRYERWNCSERPDYDENSTLFKYHDLLGRTLRAANRETAFVSAITSAGIVHAVTRGCSTGNLTECGCDNRYQGGEMIDSVDGEKWSWGGCSDNIRFGVKFAKQFLDRYEKDLFEVNRNVQSLMNIHNHLVGRESIAHRMSRHCRCHGVSGSCEFKTCWRRMPDFAEIGDLLKQRYNNFAVQVARRAKKRLRRKERSARKIPLRDNEMVYVNRSPNYCERNDAMGILGTQERECNQTSLRSDSCDLLCCGRGYNTRERIRTFRCKCKFVWCCHVKCKICEEKVQVHTCK